MRLGAYPCELTEGSLARAAYGADVISERHRHRFEFNREYEKILTENGLRLTGADSGWGVCRDLRVVGASMVFGVPVPIRSSNRNR